MARFLCWGDGFGPEDGTEREAGCPREAAESYCEFRDDGHADRPRERVIFVQGLKGVESFEVVTHEVIEYEARRRD